MRQAKILLQIILSKNDIMHEKRPTFISHVYQIQSTYNFLILCFKHNFTVWYMYIWHSPFIETVRFLARQAKSPYHIFLTCKSKHFLIKEVNTVCLKPPALDANLRWQQVSVVLLICSVLVLFPSELSLYNPWETQHSRRIKAVDIMMRE